MRIPFRSMDHWIRLPVPDHSPEHLSSYASIKMPGIRVNLSREPIKEDRYWNRLVVFADGRRPTWEEVEVCRQDLLGNNGIALLVFPPISQEPPADTVTLLQPHGWGDELNTLWRLESTTISVLRSYERHQASETRVFSSNAGNLLLVTVAGMTLPDYTWMRQLKHDRFGHEAFGFWPWYPAMIQDALPAGHAALWSLPGMSVPRVEVFS